MKMKFIDMFGQRVPQMNFEGQTSIPTYTGSFFSVVMVMTISMIVAVRTKQMLNFELSQIIIGEREGAFTTNNKSLNVTSFQVAFQVNDFVTKKAYDDSNMVRWFVRIVDASSLDYFNSSSLEVGVHKCNESDWKKFFKAKPDKKKRIEKLK